MNGRGGPSHNHSALVGRAWCLSLLSRESSLSDAWWLPQMASQACYGSEVIVSSVLNLSTDVTELCFAWPSGH